MKPFSAIFLSILLLGGTGLLRGQTAAGEEQTTATQNLPPPTPYVITTQDGNSRVWERTEYELAPDGTAIPKKHDYTEIQSGLNYQDPASGQWLPSKEEIDIQPGSDGASATQGQHQSYFPGDIFQGMIKEVTPDGLQLQSRPVELFYADDTNSVLIAILTNSVGELASSNQIVYPNAFEGADASIRYTYRKAGFEQDVIVQGQLPDPAALGLDPAKTRLGMLTVFFDNNTPAVTPGAVDTADGLNDSTLTFGSMTMGPGRAFSIGDTEPTTPPANATPAQWLNWMTNSAQQAGETPTFKRWFQLDGRNYLMEEVPYHRVAAQLSQLPAATARQDVIGTKLYAANTFLEAIPARLLSPSTQASKSKMTRLARNEQPHGLVLDYVTVVGSSSYTFQGDTTYYVSGSCYFNSITLEGGTVIKYANYNSATAYIEVGGTVTCNTSSYRPAIFTAYDDDTVGEKLYYSTGSPSGLYADPAIYAPNGFNLSNVRISYADEAVQVDYSGTSSTLSDSQLIDFQLMAKIGNGSADNITLTCNNCLFEGPYYGYFAWDNGTYEGGDRYKLNNCTIDNISYLVSGTSAPYYVNATNCIFANGSLYMSGSYTRQGGCNGFYNTGYTFGSSATTNSSNPFQTVGSGSFYLTNSTFRGIGSTVIGSALLADLKTKTTWPPLLLTNQTISTNITLAPYAIRDTNSSPDLGYHYVPIDYIADLCSITNATLTLTNGVALATYNEAGVKLKDNSAIVSIGSPLYPNWFARYSSVQDQSVALGGTNNYNGMDVYPSYTSSKPNGTYQFTKFACPAGGGFHLDDYSTASYGSLNVQECEFWSGTNVLGGTNGTTLLLDNNLFARSSIGAVGTGSLSFSNNLVWGTASAQLNPSSGTVWYAYNNDFDSTTIASSTLTNGYNAYLHCTNYLNPTNSTDIFSSSTLAYKSSWLGTFYQPTSSLLINMGSTTADQVGLYHYTTQTNQVPETNSPVDIGYHYVATDAYGNPLDLNGNGIPDYLEDANGDGIYDSGDLGDWQSFFNLNLLITRPRNGSSLP